MVEQFDAGMVNWARAQFAMTAMYHWIFVPLTLGLSFLLAFFETIYVRTGNEIWKRITRFWMALFAVNFAIGVATGIILEFEFGTNWSNYSWMVGDIFGAPLAIEGIFAFFIEATFFAVMFFGWDRASKGMHLLSTWMVAIGSNLSALWILVANGWMQFPVGMVFNAEKARFEMQDIAAVIFSPYAIGKFTHATSSGFMLAALFVVSVSSWFLLKGRHEDIARRSIAVAAVFGLFSSVFVGLTGDEGAYNIARHQPMKLAAMEGLYDGSRGQGLIAFGVPNLAKKPGDKADAFAFKIEVPQLLSLLANRQLNSFVPGVNDLLYGNAAEKVEGVNRRIERGREAVAALKAYREGRKAGKLPAGSVPAAFQKNQADMGYGYLADPAEAVPPVALTFTAFRVMVGLGTVLPLLFAAYLFFLWKGTLAGQTMLLRLGVLGFFLGHLAQQAGWVVAEVGRQPWAIQGLLPVTVARSNLTAATVSTTFFVFLALFAVLLAAEVRIMLRQIAIGPEED